MSSAGSPLPYVVPPVAEAPARPTARRLPWGFVAAGTLAVVGAVMNFVGLSGFPNNAPVEMLMAFGIGLDILAVVVVCIVGLIVALTRPLGRPSRIFPWLGLGFAMVALIAWAITAGGLFDTLFAGGRGRYMNDTFGPFLLGIPWALGAIFSAFGMRHPSTTGRTVASIVGIALWAIVLAGVAASSILYGLDLTD